MRIKVEEKTRQVITVIRDNNVRSMYYYLYINDLQLSAQTETTAKYASVLTPRTQLKVVTNVMKGIYISIYMCWYFGNSYHINQLS